ncbi:nuclear transport factor 2 family protein [Actinomadura alba]|uniref:Nuclear transport factor 2 family protein n=1 Tax=Actinomadura alba TaxID=406431 RepID=A0ABR7LR64_9ACTN|nr:nuclear transport factor 2 family protein [Actinomadura alba]
MRSYGDTAVVDAVQRQVTTARGHDASGSFRLVAVCRVTSDGWRIAHLQLSGPLIAPTEMPSLRPSDVDGADPMNEVVR